MTDSLFDTDTLDALDASPYKPGSFWSIVHKRATEGEKLVRAVTVGMILGVETWDNGFLIEHQEWLNRDGPDGMMWGPVPDPEERQHVAMWTGRHAKFLGPHVWLDEITKASLLDEPTWRIFRQEAQVWVDSWIWTGEQWANAMPLTVEHPGLSWPVFTPGRTCTHDRPEWRWTRSVLGTFCRYCGAKISDTALPEPGRCMWWSYQGSMGNGRPPDDHPDDCSWCERSEQ